jgi:hypothetical protein
MAFISLALPWWVVTISTTGPLGITTYDEATLYLYEAKVSITGWRLFGIAIGVTHPWYASTALAFVVLSGLLGLTSDVIANGRKIVLTLGAILALFSIIIFAAGLQNDISNGAVGRFYPTGASLFSSGSYTYLGTLSVNYSGYLSFGFWLALVAAIIMFWSLAKVASSSSIKSGNFSVV